MLIDQQEVTIVKAMEAICALLAALVMGVVAVGQMPKVPQAASTPPAEGALAAVAAIRVQWAQNWNAKQLGPILQAYTPDAVLLSPNGQRVSGREAIGKFWKQRMDSEMGPLTLEPVFADCSGDLAYESGTAKYTLPASPASGTHTMTPAPGNARPIEGSYLVVLRRQADGRWLVVQHAFTEALLKSLVEDKHPKAKPNPFPPQNQ
jgi:uncharacterized protein (TIGR02246 family)